MGLAIQAPADPILAIATESSAAEGANTAPSPAEGVFAALLAALLGEQPSARSEEDGSLALPPAPPEEPSSDPTVAEAALALLGAAAALPVPGPLPEPAPAAPSGSSATLLSTTDVPASASNVATPSANESGSIAEAPAPGLPATPAEAPVAEGPSTGAASEASSPELAAATGEVALHAPALPVRTRGPAAEEPARPRPEASEGPPPAGTDTPRVPAGMVRSVGNATEESEGDAANGSGPKTGERPAPRASATGIAHAAPNSAVGELRQQQTVESAPLAPTDVAPASESAAELPPQIDQVASAVIENVEAGGGEARIHLDPADLGEVVIHVRTEGDAVHIDVQAERPDAARLLRDHTQDLSNLLGSRGLNLSDVNVGVGGGNAESPFDRQENTPRPAAGEFAGILGLGEEDSSSSSRLSRLRAAYNPDGALLYRV